MENEIWKDIPGYEGTYQVSNFGNIKRISISNRPHLNGIIRQWKTKDGYTMVSLRDSRCRRKGLLVHRLVAFSFVDGYTDNMQVNHKNEIKSDNRAENLEWVTSIQNLSYGTRKDRVILALSKPVVSIKNGVEKRYTGIKDASRQTGVHTANICAVLRGKRHHAGGYVWKYY